VDIPLETFMMLVANLKKAWYGVEPKEGEIESLLETLLQICRIVIMDRGPFLIAPGSTFTVRVPLDNFQQFGLDPMDERVLGYLFGVFASDGQVSIMFDASEFQTLFGGVNERKRIHS
jgi:hypothetical protein